LCLVVSGSRPCYRSHEESGSRRIEHSGGNLMARNRFGCNRISRRTFLADTGMGFTGLALGAMLLEDRSLRADNPLPDGQPHFPPRPKSVIWIFHCGGVSHVESFDVKPELNRYAGQTIENTPYRSVLNTEGRDVIAGNPSHGNRRVLMGLNTGYKRY